MKLEGDVRLTLCARVDAFLDSMFSHPFTSVVVDINRAEGIDSTTLGLLAKLALRARRERDIQPTLFSVNRDLTRVVRSMGLDRVFTIVEAMPDVEAEQELPEVNASDDVIRRQVLDAHQVLMNLDHRNVTAFRDLVAALQTG